MKSLLAIVEFQNIAIFTDLEALKFDFGKLLPWKSQHSELLNL